MTERANVAKELAVKDGHDWETLSPEMVNAYLHNADLAIEERSRPPVNELNPQPMYVCDRCQDKAYIGDKPCSECNPVGLPAEEVHPQEGKPTLLIIPQVLDGMTLDETVEVARNLIKADAPTDEDKPHKHFYRKDGTCQCGQVKKVKKAK